MVSRVQALRTFIAYERNASKVRYTLPDGQKVKFLDDQKTYLI